MSSYVLHFISSLAVGRAYFCMSWKWCTGFFLFIYTNEDWVHGSQSDAIPSISTRLYVCCGISGRSGYHLLYL